MILHHCWVTAALVVVVSSGRFVNAAAKCDPNPCGEGAECQNVGAIAVCACPPGTTGNPFESCQSTSSSTTLYTTDSSSTTSSSTEASTESLGTSSVSSVGSSSPVSYTPIYSTSPRGSSAAVEITTGLPVELPPATTPQESRHTSAYAATPPDALRSPVGNSGEYTSMYEDAFHHRPNSNYHNSYHNADREAPIRADDYHNRYNPERTEPVRGTATAASDENRSVYNVERPGPIRGDDVRKHSSYHHHNNNYDDASSGSRYEPQRHRVPPMASDRNDHYRPRDRETSNNYYQEQSQQDYSRRPPAQSPEVAYDRVYDERYASKSHDDTVKDPMGVYSNCKNVNGVVVCADTGEPTREREREPIEHQQSMMHKPSGNVVTSGTYYYTDREDAYRTKPFSATSSSSSSAGSYHGRDRDEMYRPLSASQQNTYHYDNDRRPSAGHHNQHRNKYQNHHEDQPQYKPYHHDRYEHQQKKSSNAGGGGHSPGDVVQEFVVQSAESVEAPSIMVTQQTPTVRPYHHQKIDPSVKSAGDQEQCRRFCGENSICRQMRGRPICGCPAGYTGDPAVRCVAAEDQTRMNNRCMKHTECSDKQVCEEGQCVDPCSDHRPAAASVMIKEDRNVLRMSHYRRNSKQIQFYDMPRRGGGAEIITMNSEMPIKKKKHYCGPNTKCHVVDHTPLCGCLEGFTGNPYMRCVPATGK